MDHSRWPLTSEDAGSIQPVHVGFLANKVALGQVYLRLLRFSPVSIIPPLLRTDILMQFV